MSKERGLVMIYPEFQWEIYEQMFKFPVEERTDCLFKMVQEVKGEILGYTEKTAPEIAIEFIKHGIKAQSYTIKEPPIE